MLKQRDCCAGRALLAPVFIAQPALPYPLSAQEPYIDTETQTLHWTKHTAEYFANLNDIIASYPLLQVVCSFASHLHNGINAQLPLACSAKRMLHHYFVMTAQGRCLAFNCVCRIPPRRFLCSIALKGHFCRVIDCRNSHWRLFCQQWEPAIFLQI